MNTKTKILLFGSALLAVKVYSNNQRSSSNNQQGDGSNNQQGGGSNNQQGDGSNTPQGDGSNNQQGDGSTDIDLSDVGEVIKDTIENNQENQENNAQVSGIFDPQRTQNIVLDLVDAKVIVLPSTKLSMGNGKISITLDLVYKGGNKTSIVTVLKFIERPQGCMPSDLFYARSHVFQANKTLQWKKKTTFMCNTSGVTEKQVRKAYEAWFMKKMLQQ